MRRGVAVRTDEVTTVAMDVPTSHGAAPTTCVRTSGTRLMVPHAAAVTRSCSDSIEYTRPTNCVCM